MREEQAPQLPLHLGRDHAGHDVVADLALLPDLLVVGSHEHAQALWLNTVLAKLTDTRSPKELRLLLLTPNDSHGSDYGSDFGMFPHLLTPPVTTAYKTRLALRWAIDEMERRYKTCARAGVRNIEGFNHRPTHAGADDGIPRRLPYVVIVISGLTDLKPIHQTDIEGCIARLAQLSRAVGIHMIVATLQPTVSPIIEKNFPARIMFLLGTNKANESLPGQKDIHYHPPETDAPIRLRQPLPSYEIRQTEPILPDFDQALIKWLENGSSSETQEQDPLIDAAERIIRSGDDIWPWITQP
jgi:S-DNA-T family DNA segregation ATPase FtsK/SpoIIIE